MSKDRLPIVFSPGICGGHATLQGTRLDMKWVYHHRREHYSFIATWWPNVTKSMWDDAVQLVNDILEEHESEVTKDRDRLLAKLTEYVG